MVRKDLMLLGECMYDDVGIGFCITGHCLRSLQIFFPQLINRGNMSRFANCRNFTRVISQTSLKPAEETFPEKHEIWRNSQIELQSFYERRQPPRIWQHTSMCCCSCSPLRCNSNPTSCPHRCDGCPVFSAPARAPAWALPSVPQSVPNNNSCRSRCDTRSPSRSRYARKDSCL